MGKSRYFPFGCELSDNTYQALNSASTLAANGLLRSTLGAVFPLFTLQMYKGLVIGWATSLLAFVTVAMMPVPWVLFKYGKEIRARSSYETLKVRVCCREVVFEGEFEFGSHFGSPGV